MRITGNTHSSTASAAGTSRAARRTGKLLSSAAAAVAVTGLVLTGCAPAEPTGPTTLRVGISALSEADSIDPSKASTNGGYAIARQLFDSLTEYGPDGGWRPRLAESVTAGATAAEWTVVLKDAQWHDGTPVTADDVIYTVKRWFSEELPPAGKLSMVDPEQIEKVDEKTVTFHLIKPTVTFPEALTSPQTSILPQGFDVENPVGSGPFEFEAITPGVQVSFTANEDYFGDGPYVDELIISSFADASGQVNALTSNQIDVAANVDPSLLTVLDAAGDGYDVFHYPTSGALTWVMHTQKEPFTDVVVRQALRLAIDREALIEQVYSGFGKVGNDVFSPFDPLYNEDLPQRSYDPEAAKALLEGAGYTLPVKVDLYGAPNQPTSDRQNEFLVEQAKAAGFEIEFHQMDMATFYGEAYGTYPLSLSYWGFSGIFDQAAMTITKTAPYNGSKWVDEEYDTLFNEAIETVDDAARKALVAQMQAIEHERGAYLVPIFLEAMVGHSTSVTGFQPYPNESGALGFNFSILQVQG